MKAPTPFWESISRYTNSLVILHTWPTVTFRIACTVIVLNVPDLQVVVAPSIERQNKFKLCHVQLPLQCPATLTKSVALIKRKTQCLTESGSGIER
jgi:hypothetical protein